MSLAQLHYFLAVAEVGKVRGAASMIGIAQPAISRQLRLLEDELGTRLFVRTPRKMVLSIPGEVLRGYARAITGDVRAAERAVRQAPSNDIDAIDLYHLRSFVAVAHAGHVSRAAARLHIVQPALSRQIQKLESGLGVRLFQRTSRGMVLSSAGGVFLAHAEAIVARMTEAHTAVQESA